MVGTRTGMPSASQLASPGAVLLPYIQRNILLALQRSVQFNGQYTRISPKGILAFRAQLVYYVMYYS